MESPPPKNVPELKSFLGMVNYYGKFLPNPLPTIEERDPLAME